MSASLGSLPPELYSAILSSVTSEDRQSTTLSLTRALPVAPIPEFHLFTHIRLKRAEQVIQLYRRLRKARDEAGWVEGFALETWTVDADSVVNLVHLLFRVKEMALFIGPNFAPEHLEEMFETPRLSLQFISLRFRPYVQKATYYQFLKGAYFDSTLHALSRWPSSKDHALPSLSIVQDPIDPAIAQKQHFAQPLVFFRLDPLTALVRSDYLRYLTSLRLRIPGRQFIRFICSHPGSLPSIDILDVSTSLMVEAEIETILMRFTTLRHLIADRCGMKRVDLLEVGEWVTIGKSCALAGVKRAKDREKKLKLWLEANARIALAHTAQAVGVDDGTVGLPGAARPRRGRRGLATATISLRDQEERGGSLPPLSSNIQVERIRILPPSPSLVSLALSPSSHLPRDRYPDILTDFERGWNEGLAQLTAVRNRLRQSWQNGIRVVRFAQEGSSLEEGLDGLVDVPQGAEAGFHDNANVGIPILCLAGPGRSDDHVAGCGHARGWDIWNDDL